MENLGTLGGNQTIAYDILLMVPSSLDFLCSAGDPYDPLG